VLWVRLNPELTRAVSVHTYFHGRLLSAPAPAAGRIRAVSQWGKHGTMPMNWQELSIAADSDDVEFRAMTDADRGIRLEDYNRATYLKLHTQGREAQASPLARKWPLRFPGTWAGLINFSRPVDTEVRLRRNPELAMVSYFNNAVINRYFLR